MRIPRWMMWVVLAGCGDSGQDGAQAGHGADAGLVDAGSHHQGGQGGNDSQAGAGHTGQSGGGQGGSGSKPLQVPRIYPLVRASTPSGLIVDTSLEMIGEDAGTDPAGDNNSLGQIVQDRIYTPGPTSLLRIVRELDDRTAGIDTDRSKHPCLNSTPIERSWMFPGGQSFSVKLQCIQEWSGGWVAFGFAASDRDEDAGAAGSGNDFFLVEGQDGGMGGAYRVHAGDVEAWITVADRRAPNNSQVVMHLAVDSTAASTELSFAGSGVGFCSAHLKTADNYLFIRGKPNAPPPPGAPIGHYCGSERIGCFSATELHTNLGAAAVSCRSIASAHFAIHGALDASSDPEGNVMPGTIYKHFETKPEGITAF